MQGLVAATCCSHKIMCCSYRRMSHLCNVLSFWHVPWSWTRWTRCNMSQGQNCPSYTSLHVKLSRHTGGHGAATCSSNMYSPHFYVCVRNVIFSLLHAPYVWPTQDFVVATCRCDLTQHHDPSYVGSFKSFEGSYKVLRICGETWI